METNLFNRISSSIDNVDSICVSTPAGRAVTYRELFDQTAQMANALVSLGLRPGDRLAAQVEKSFSAIVLYLATVRAGGVFLPLNTAYTPPEVEYFLRDAGPKLFICDPGSLTTLSLIAEGAGAKVLTLDANGQGGLADEAASHLSEFRTVDRAADDLAAMLYTSGTTGRSKGAMLTHDNLFSNPPSRKSSFESQNTTYRGKFRTNVNRGSRWN